MNANEEAKGIFWCKTSDFEKIKSRIEAELKTIIWSDKKPSILPYLSQKGFDLFYVNLVNNNGDIIDDSILAAMLVQISNIYENCYVRFDVTEGDLFLIETMSQIQDDQDIDIEDGCSIVYKNELYRIDEDYSKANNAYLNVKEENKYPKIIQQYFHAFLEKTKNEKLYHNIKLFIPKQLKRMLLYDENYITLITQNAKYKTSLKDENQLDLVETCVKFRRYQLALLDSQPIKVTQQFIDKVGNISSRKVRLSYLLCCAYENIKNDEKTVKYLNEANDEAFSYLEQDEKQKEEDNDFSWLENTCPPEYSYDDIGTEMAERFTAFVKEVSEFDKIDDEGPINFNFESFSNKLDHFLDSSSDENEEEEEMNDNEQFDVEFSQMIKDDEDKQLQHFVNGDDDPLNYATAYINKSLESETSPNGPASQYINLFGIK